MSGQAAAGGWFLSGPQNPRLSVEGPSKAFYVYSLNDIKLLVPRAQSISTLATFSKDRDRQALPHHSHHGRKPPSLASTVSWVCRYLLEPLQTLHNISRPNPAIPPPLRTFPRSCHVLRRPRTFEPPHFPRSQISLLQHLSHLFGSSHPYASDSFRSTSCLPGLLPFP